MPQIGRKIYYDLATGNAVQDTGECDGSLVLPTTQAQDFATWLSLSQRVPSTIGCIQLNYGDLAQEFGGSNGYHVDLATTTIIFDTTPPIPVLDVVKQRKKDELLAARNNALETFTSSALGTPHTYLSRAESIPNDMLLLTSEYSFAKSTDYDGLPLPWYSVEDGNTMHTGAQIIQVYLDARKSVQNKMLRGGTKNAQVGACTTTDQVATIGWPNPNPPVVPVGLAGTAGAAGSGQVTLNWTANTDVTMLGGGGYRVYVDGAKVNAALVTAATYTASALALGAHTFTISAVDTDGLESAQCAVITVTVS